MSTGARFLQRQRMGLAEAWLTVALCVVLAFAGGLAVRGMVQHADRVVRSVVADTTHSHAPVHDARVPAVTTRPAWTSVPPGFVRVGSDFRPRPYVAPRPTRP
jgi:hypothetical protein